METMAVREGCQDSCRKFLVTLTDEKGNERYVSAEDAWLTEQGLDVGDYWPCELEKRRGYTNEHTDFWHKKVQ